MSLKAPHYEDQLAVNAGMDLRMQNEKLRKENVTPTKQAMKTLRDLRDFLNKASDTALDSPLIVFDDRDGIGCSRLRLLRIGKPWAVSEHNETSLPSADYRYELSALNPEDRRRLKANTHFLKRGQLVFDREGSDTHVCGEYFRFPTITPKQQSNEPPIQS